MSAESRRIYASHFKSVTPYTGEHRTVHIPANVERVRDIDPCFLCGVRGDVGCRHREAA